MAASSTSAMMSNTPEINNLIEVSQEVSDSKSKGSHKYKGRQSDVWDHFTKIIDEDTGKPKGAKCNYCSSVYSWVSRNVTSTLRDHTSRCSNFPFNKDKKQKLLSWTNNGKGGSSLAVWKFDQELCRNALAKMIIMDELSFKFVEHEGFHQFCSVMQPNFKLLSRTTLARDCLTLYASEKQKLKDMFVKSNYRVCLTTDSWTSLQNLSYMCLTAHFIDKDWKLHKIILNFCVILSHKGEEIGRAIEGCLTEWGIDKLCTLTMDNATSNDVVVSYLKRKMSKTTESFFLGGKFFHVRCCAHILNLIVKDGLSELKEAVSRIRVAVSYVRSSPKRAQFFKDCVEKGSITDKNSLCLDVQTRWNSTYLMLDTAIKFQKAFERLEEDDPLFKIELNDECPVSSDWESARSFTTFLQKFYDATVRLSGSLYVSSNCYFHEVCGIDSFITESLLSNDSTLKAMAKKMKNKFEKYWGNIEKVNMKLLLVVVLDPRYKLKYVRFCYSEVYDSDKVNELTCKVKETFDSAYEEYKKLESDSYSNHMEVDQVCSRTRDQLSSLKTRFQRQLQKEESAGDKSEVNKYLAEPCEKEGPHFDILGWWRMNSSKYKVLAELARDILAIPVSTVASESAFSTGGRVLDKFRSSLTPKLVECLICSQDWLRASPLPIQVEESLAEIEDLESGLTTN